MLTNLYKETIDEGHIIAVKDTELQRKTWMTTVNIKELTNDSNEWMKANEWRPADENKRMKANGWRQADEDR
jgi:hypothetical protein